MTTIDVQKAPRDRVLPMHVPSYSYQYPTVATVRLAAVKEGLYHPNLPTFRRMDMDTCAQKLPDEHCRTTTSCGPDDFKRANLSFFKPPKRSLTTMEITETGRKLHRSYTTPEELKNARKEWSTFLNKCPERYEIRLPEIPQNKDLHFRGYAVRYIRPEVTQSWRYTLTQEPTLDQFAQKPIPANIYARYRDTVPQFNRNISSEPWR